MIFDEIDAFEANAQEEGDPILLGKRANLTLPDRKTVMGSAPLLLQSSRILAAMKLSDWREFHVPCPHCEEPQVLK